MTQVKKNLTIEEAFKKFNGSKNGLTEEDVKRNQSTFGLNEIPEKHVSPIIRFLHYLWGPIPWMIEAAIILSFIVKDWTDFWIILLLLISKSFLILLFIV